MLNLLKKYEEDYCANGYYGIVDEPIHRFYDRGSHLILSAPHAVRTFRNGKIKQPDLYTGALTQAVGEHDSLSTILCRRFANEKHSITDFITDNHLEQHYFLDIHGMSHKREFELAVGTGILPAQDYTPIIESIDKLATKFQIRWVLNHPDYTGRFGLTGDIQRRLQQPKILQLEWRLDMRDFYHFSDNVLFRTIPFLCDLAAKATTLV